MPVEQALYLLNCLLKPLEDSLPHPALCRCCGGWAGEKLEWWGLTRQGSLGGAEAHLACAVEVGGGRWHSNLLDAERKGCLGRLLKRQCQELKLALARMR